MPLPEYQLAQKLCQSFKKSLDASGLQATISATLTVNSSTKLTTILRQYEDHEVSYASLQDNPKLAKLIEQIYSQVHYWLNETEFSFELYLPDDNQSLSERLRSMARWCDDFVHAFGLAHAKTDRQLTKETRTLLADIVEICRIEWRDITADNQAEFDYQQLIEFIRMAVIDLHSDYHSHKLLQDSNSCVTTSGAKQSHQ